ncbi:MAG TPA: hypothetical protein VFM95_05005, partial [Microcella sp.]|nr:hypothetical protein [Microcella sp.]
SFRLDRGAGVFDESGGVVSVLVSFATEATFDVQTPNDRAARILLATTPDARIAPPNQLGPVAITLPAWSAAVVRVR